MSWHLPTWGWGAHCHLSQFSRCDGGKGLLRGMGGMGRRQPAGIMEKTLDLNLGQRLVGLPRCCTGKESACNAGDLGDAGLIPGSGRYSEEEPGRLQSLGLQRVGHDWVHTVAQRLANLTTQTAAAGSPTSLQGLFSAVMWEMEEEWSMPGISHSECISSWMWGPLKKPLATDSTVAVQEDTSWTWCLKSQVGSELLLGHVNLGQVLYVSNPQFPNL